MFYAVSTILIFKGGVDNVKNRRSGQRLAKRNPVKWSSIQQPQDHQFLEDTFNVAGDSALSVKEKCYDVEAPTPQHASWRQLTELIAQSSARKNLTLESALAEVDEHIYLV